MGIFDKDKKFLTEKNGLGGFELKICMNCNPDAENKACGSCKFFQDAIDRLAAYEASGLTPKEVGKLKKRFTPMIDAKDPKLIEESFPLGKKDGEEDNGEI